LAIGKEKREKEVEQKKVLAEEKALEEAVLYFTSDKGFARLVQGMIEKYQSLGHWGGSVKLTSLKDEEREALGSFFRKDFSRQKTATISLEHFAKALEQTRFSEISPVDLLEAIQGGPILSNTEKYAQKEEAKRGFFECLAFLYLDEYCQLWLKAIGEKQPGTRQVHIIYDRDPNLLNRQMEQVLKALSVLSERNANEIERLSVFARRITKDPHGFDSNSETGRLLIHALRILSNYRLQQNDEASISSSDTLRGAEELNELYYSFGLLRDDLWNFVTCTGILAFPKRENTSSEGSPLGERDKPFESRVRLVGYLERAYQERITLNLPLREVVKLGIVIPGNYLNKVYVVENSGVFSALLDLFEDFIIENGLDTVPNPPLTCTHGQFKLASLLLLDKLAASGTTIFYSGDFDPEGLMMLDQLINRYPGQLIPWHYSQEDYHACISDQVLGLSRLKKLDGVKSLQIEFLKEELKRTKLAGYQEGILGRLWEDIKQNLCLSNTNCGP